MFCPECRRERRQVQSRDSEGRRVHSPTRALSYLKSNLQQRYGLSLGRYFSMLHRCGYRCEACGDYSGQRRLAVDHCHESGDVRGILCTRCNAALGHLKDDPARIRGVLAYLDTHL